MKYSRKMSAGALLTSLFLIGLLPVTLRAQDRLPTMPRYDRYEKMRQGILGAIKGGTVDVQWAPDGQSFTFFKDGKEVRYEIASRKIVDASQEEESVTSGQTVTGKFQMEQEGRMSPGRGRQFNDTYSPDGNLRAYYKEYNVHISKVDGSDDIAVTTDGNALNRVKFGQACWVYGEELDMREAMWWSPDSKRLAYYGFNLEPVQDYYVISEQTGIQDKLNAEAYPVAGALNPKVSLYIYDLATKNNFQVDTDLADPSLAEYVYDIRWSPDGSALLYTRTNRHQNHQQLVAVDPSNGKARVIIDENWSKTWIENHPDLIWLDKQQVGEPQQFLWISERNGYRNIYLGDLDGAPLKPITQYRFDVQRIVGIDQKNGVVFFTARDGDNPYRLQLHRIKLDGSDDHRLTDPSWNNSVSLAPDYSHFVDVRQNLTTPPESALYDSSGNIIEILAKSDLSQYNSLGLKRAERFKFRAADGTTDLYGWLTFPSDFDPAKKYPLLLSIYGGPDSGSGEERFALPNPVTEFGFIVAWIDGRGTVGRGKAFRDAVYGKLGTVEIDDQAAGVKYLGERPYIDPKRVGVFGTSYGGYASVMCLLRHPNTFQVAVASSPVTDWRNYDTVYTERYMGLPTPDDNLAGYEAGSAMKYAQNLKGRLMLFYGTADDNVHPSNTLQLVQALQRLDKGFDVMVGPDMGHSGINANRMWEYFIDYLILNRDKQPLAKVYDARRRRLATAKRANSAG